MMTDLQMDAMQRLVSLGLDEELIDQTPGGVSVEHHHRWLTEASDDDILDWYQEKGTN